MVAPEEAMARLTPLAPSQGFGPETLEAFTGSERVLGILPFVADASSTLRWHHLLFTEDTILAVPAVAEPAPDATDLFLPRGAEGRADASSRDGPR